MTLVTLIKLLVHNFVCKKNVKSVTNASKSKRLIDTFQTNSSTHKSVEEIHSITLAVVPHVIQDFRTNQTIWYIIS